MLSFGRDTVTTARFREQRYDASADRSTLKWGVRMRRVIVGIALGTVGTVIVGMPAAADHVHFRVVGNGQCVLLAPNGGEQHVELPHAEEFPRIAVTHFMSTSTSVSPARSERYTSRTLPTAS